MKKNLMKAMLPGERPKLTVVHNQAKQTRKEEEKKEKEEQKQQYKNWIMPDQASGYIKSKKHDYL